MMQSSAASGRSASMMCTAAVPPAIHNEYACRIVQLPGSWEGGDTQSKGIIKALIIFIFIMHLFFLISELYKSQ